MICSGKCKADVIIVLDTSLSVGWSNSYHIRSFLSNLTDHVINNLDLGSGRIPLGLLMYSTGVYPLFNLSQFTTAAQILAEIASSNFSRGATNTAAAFANVRENMLTLLAGARDDVPKVVLVLYDGKSSNPYAAEVRSCAL